MVTRSRLAHWRGSPAVIAAAVAAVVVCWILGNPRSSGPDEPSHMIAAAGLVRGQGDGRPNPDPNQPGTRLYDVPGMVGAPDPGCWAATFDANVPVACQSTVPLSTTTRAMPTTSYNYSPWSLILPGLASFLPSAGGYAYAARLLNALVPVALVGWSLTIWTRRSAYAAAVALLALTPIAWFTFGVVSPSSIAIAGGLALWTALLAADRVSPSVIPISWLALAGWAAVLLPRRDGPLWATLIVLACCWVLRTRPRDLLVGTGSARRVLIGVAALLPILTPITNGDRGFNLLLAFSPLGLVAVDLLARRAEQLESTAARRALVGYCVGAAMIGAGLAVASRPGGFQGSTIRLVIAATGRHLRQLVGVLGWLSTPVPMVAVFACWIAVGALAGIGLIEYRRATLIAATGLAVTIVVAWLLELGQGANYGEYWQGRYSMPFVVGLPLVLAWRPAGGDRLDGRSSTALAAPIRWTAWGVSNLAFIAAQQRWGVGLSGSWNAFDWNTWGAPVEPVALIVAHVVATFVLVESCATERVRTAA
jgi:hypothetical protein